MAGGKITRIVGGTNSIECESWTVYTDEFKAYAGEFSHFTASKGIMLGEPKDSPSSYTYFEKAWWTDKDGKEIKEARLGDKVQFHLKMKNIQSPKGKKVNLELREWNEFNLLLYLLSFANKELIGHKSLDEYQKINIVSANADGKVLTDWALNENSEITIDILLDEESLLKMIINDEARDLEFYFRCRYIDDETNLPEIAELPWETWNYLKVKPKPVVEPIIFVHASNEHLLPAIYSAKEGNPWYIAPIPNAMYGNKFKTLTKPYDNPNLKKELTFFEKNAYKIAIRKLEKGNLIFNTGKKGTTSRLYEYNVTYIDGQYKDKILMGVNRGTGVRGETSKGINQIEAQVQRGLPNTIKTIGEIAGIFGVLSDLSALLRGVADHEIPMPSIVPPFIAMEVNRMMKENDEFIIEHWNIDLQKAIIEGKDFTKDFLENNDINRSKNLGFKVIDMSEDGMTKVLNKEIDAIKDLTNSNSPKMLESLSNIGEGNRDSGLLIQSMEGLDKFNRITTFHYIHAIFVKDLKI
ncbi:hypothetical protein ABEG63_04650 [Chryseobacterium sp. C39-AII1]|uniref:hypothetical protein n=1 Tax=Chryseobacterium sp. C39-AII1 TaxID=3080332 RepID=UPI0032092BF6